MKKFVWLSVVALCFPLVGMAQNANDDLYYTPKKEKAPQENREQREYGRTTNGPTSVYVNPGTTVVVKDLKGNVRDVDEYNRRYTSADNNFVIQDDTLVIEEKDYDNRGEWLNGFDGTESDYEYAQRLIRFRNPANAIPVGSPLYWDVVYGTNSWEWNVYNDGFYAYVFPTYSNRLWFDWRYGSIGMSWNYPNYYGWGGYYPGYWGGYWGPSWGWGHHHHGWHDPWYGNSWRHPYYYDNRPINLSQSRPGSSSVRPGTTSRPSGSSIGSGTTSRPSYGRVVGTRPSSSGAFARPSGSTTRPSSGTGIITSRPGTESGMGTTRPSGSGSSRPSSSYTRPSTSGSSTSRPSYEYTRPSSTRSSESNYGGSSSSDYNRGSSTYSRPSGSSSSGSYRNSGSSSRSTYSAPSSGSRSSGSYSGGGSSSRPSGGGGSSRGGRR